MKRVRLGEGVERVCLAPEEAGRFEPVAFSDGRGEYLRQVGFDCAPRPVWRLESVEGDGAVKQTANGEVIVFEDGVPRKVRDSHSATLRFACEGGHVLTGLGQHEAGVFDYSDASERLYQHNMKISIPFLLSSAGWGLWIEAGCAMRYTGEGDIFTFWLDAVDEVRYVVIRGESCAEVLKKLAALAGKPALLPKWAFGYMQSKERYHTSSEVLDVAREFRRRGLGLDCIVQDWFTWREGYWGDKTPDPERYPVVKALIDALHAMDVRFMVSVWPNAAQGRDCDEFRAAGAFLPGSRIYDAFSPAARDIYWNQCKRFWMGGGADALWCDSCEPIIDPDWCGEEKRDEDERMRLLTEASEVRMDPERMNDYGAYHLRGLREHWLRDYPDKRPVFLARSGGVDASALGAILWSGDVAARWEVLRQQITEGLKIACSGICWWTLDIGAFFVGRGDQWFADGDYPAGVDDPAYRELYIRWFQFGAMLPVFRSHGTDTPREPWRFGGDGSREYRCLRDTIALRYRLLPYIYAAAARASRDGLPMLRAMMVAFPDSPALHALHDQYMLGDALLVKPVTRPISEGGDATEVELPAGGWFDLFTRAYFPGGGRVEVSTPLERFPAFVRAGSILPVAEPVQCVKQLPVPARELWVFGGADGAFELYDDAGDGPAEGFVIPMRYDDAARALALGDCVGELPGPVEFSIRLFRPDGAPVERSARYAGAQMRISFDN